MVSQALPVESGGKCVGNMSGLSLSKWKSQPSSSQVRFFSTMKAVCPHATENKSIGTWYSTETVLTHARGPFFTVWPCQFPDDGDQLWGYCTQWTGNCTLAGSPTRAGSKCVYVTYSQIWLREKAISARSKATAGDDQEEWVKLEGVGGGVIMGRGRWIRRFHRLPFHAFKRSAYTQTIPAREALILNVSTGGAG